jgi:hypothetical protein
VIVIIDVSIFVPFKMEISLPHLRVMLSEAAELGATRALAQAGVIKPLVTKAEAYRIYGRANVESWVRAGLIPIHKDGDFNTKVRLERIQLEVIAKSNNWKAYIPKEDR